MTNNLQFLSDMLLIKYYSVCIFIVFYFMGRQDTLHKKKEKRSKSVSIGFYYKPRRQTNWTVSVGIALIFIEFYFAANVGGPL